MYAKKSIFVPIFKIILNKLGGIPVDRENPELLVERIGDSAKNQAALNPENTIYDAKRLIGRNINDSVIQSDIKTWPFKVKGDSKGKPIICATYKDEEKEFSAEEISSMILLKMKEVRFCNPPAYDEISIKNLYEKVSK